MYIYIYDYIILNMNNNKNRNDEHAIVYNHVSSGYTTYPGSIRTYKKI